MIKNTFDISDFVPAQSLTGTVYELVRREKAARKAKKLTQKQLAERTVLATVLSAGLSRRAKYRSFRW